MMKQPPLSLMQTTTVRRVIDIGINLTDRMLKEDWKAVVHRAIQAGVDRIILTGTSMKSSKESLELAQQWYEEEGSPNLYVTIGIHPHGAKTWNNKNTLNEMKKLLQHPLAVAVGECGLDYNRNFSSKPAQINAFKQQLLLACELNMPLFLHEREAHQDLIQVLDDVREESKAKVLPPIVIHCFTGTEFEAWTYIERGYYIGFTGTICKRDRGAHLRTLIPKLPLERLMVETDAPYMGFKKNRRNSEPADCADVAKRLGETMGVSLERICEATTTNAMQFFGISESDKDGNVGAPGKVIVGMAPTKQQGKSKSALRRARSKQKKEEERKMLEGNVLAEQKVAAEVTVDPSKRAKKLKKLLRQIDELKQRDPSTLNEDQRKKLGTEISLREELLLI